MEVLSQEEIDILLNAMKQDETANMGPVRRKLHRLRCSFGRFVYDQKTKFPYNVALKRGKPMEDTLTSAEVQQLLEAMTVEHGFEDDIDPSLVKYVEAVRREMSEHGSVANTNENNGRER